MPGSRLPGRNGPLATVGLMRLLGICAVMLVACSGSTEGQPTENAADADRAASITLPSLFEADRTLFAAHPRELEVIARPGANVDAAGLLNENRRFGRMYSPRFQLGGGAALRVGIHQDNPAMARAGFRAIAAGSRAIAADGEVVSFLPPNAPVGAELRPGDRASGAAFYLSDACTGLLVLEASPRADEVASAAQRAAVLAAMGRAISWLARNSDPLLAVDRAAPNRLLYDALAFQSCGALVGDAHGMAQSRTFVAAALAQLRDDGVFVEQGGHDTSYQAVSVRLALDVLLSGYTGEDAAALQGAWLNGARWLSGRIMADGRIDSSGNTRTCGGGESFLGRRKRVSPPSVYAALIYAAELSSDGDLRGAAGRLSAWAQANPRTNPCYP
jgi:biotin operon repressor